LQFGHQIPHGLYELGDFLNVPHQGNAQGRLPGHVGHIETATLKAQLVVLLLEPVVLGK